MRAPFTTLKRVSARPRFRLTMTEPSEAQVLAGTKTLLSMHRAVAWWSRVNSGEAYMLRGVTYQRLKKMVQDGYLTWEEIRYMAFGAPGMSDTIFQLKREYGGTFGAIEVKKPSGKVQPEQYGFLQNVIDAGGVAGIARSVDEAQRIIESGMRVPA
jgi:hypothetical protein